MSDIKKFFEKRMSTKIVPKKGLLAYNLRLLIAHNALAIVIVFAGASVRIKKRGDLHE